MTLMAYRPRPWRTYDIAVWAETRKGKRSGEER